MAMKIEPGRTAMLVAAICATARLAHADCPEGTAQATCVLHEEAVVLLTSGRYEEAATKFRAAISAGPSARSYLGYSQAVEGQGKIALAYETMLVAKRMSDEEVAASGKDAAVVGRAERIRYKLGELGGRVGFVWLRLPGGVAPQRLVAIHREGEGDLPSPLGRWITVTPDRQVLIASLDDGSQVEVVAKVAAGAQSNLVLPIPGAPRGQPQPQPQPPPPPPPGLGRPIASLYEKPPAGPPPPLPSSVVALGVLLSSPGPEVGMASLNSGFGVFGLFEQRATKSLALAFRIDYVSHPPDFVDFSTDLTASGSEIMLTTGLRTRTRTVHARIETGVTVSSVDIEGGIGPGPSPPPPPVSTTDVYPVISLGGGLELGRFRMHAGILYTVNIDDNAPQIPIRFMGMIGIDLWRR